MKQQESREIVFFDGVCNFCNFWVNFAIRHNKKQNLYFAPLQSEIARTILSAYNFNPTALSSVVFIKNNTIYTQSSAAFKIAKELKYPWKLGYIFYFIPKLMRDFFYNIIAKNRYRLFGKSQTCRIPTLNEKARFLD